MGSEESAEAKYANGEVNGDLNREHRKNSLQAETDNLDQNVENRSSPKTDSDIRQRKGKRNTKTDKKNVRSDNLQKNNKPQKVMEKFSPTRQVSFKHLLTRIPKWISNFAFFLIVCVLAALTRLWQIDEPPHIW